MNDATNEFSESFMAAVSEFLPTVEAEPHRPASDDLVVSMLHKRIAGRFIVGVWGDDILMQFEGHERPWCIQADDRSTLSALSDRCDIVACEYEAAVRDAAKCGLCQGSWPMLCPSCGPENCKPAEAYGSGVFAKLESYGAQDVEITFGGIPLTGLASGEHLSIEYEPLVTPADQPSARVSTISKAIKGVHNVEFLDVEETPTGMVVWTVGGFEASVRAAIELTLPSGSYDLYHTAEA